MKRRPHEKYFDKGLRGWVVQTAQKHYWRVAAWIDLDDLIAEGFYAYAFCKARYGHRVENKAHFMSLFKRVYMSIITDLAVKRTRIEKAGCGDIAASQIAVVGRELSVLEYLGGGMQGEAELAATFEKAPQEIKLLLHMLQEGRLDQPRLPARPVEANARDSHGRFRKVGRIRETNNEFLNRMLGLKDYDFEGQLRRLLGFDDEIQLDPGKRAGA